MRRSSEHFLSNDCGLQNGVGGIGGNATLVVLVPGHQNVATHSPVLPPAVRKYFIVY